MRVQPIDPHAASWGAALDRIGLRLRTPDNPTLFPYHFLQVTLPRIGGGAAWVFADERPQNEPAGVGFLFPRRREPTGARVYTLRYHALPGHSVPERAALEAAAAEALGAARVVLYDPSIPATFTASHQPVAGVDIGHPGPDEAEAVPRLHQQIWGSPPEFLYPADLHSVEFAAGTSLVARVPVDDAGQVVGFLIGFHKFGGPPLPADWDARYGAGARIESQIMGVLPAYRGLRIANLLKKAQAEEAWRDGIGVLNWTADPLQYPNAALNFGLLRAFAFDFVPDLYPFRNDLNRVPASRFGVTWLVGSERVRSAPMVGSRAAVLDLANHPEIRRVNVGWASLYLEARDPLIAIEIPADWTALQRDDVGQAMRWREATDRLLAHYLGIEEGRYTVTGVAVQGERRFLLAERSGPALWALLGRPA